MEQQQTSRKARIKTYLIDRFKVGSSSHQSIIRFQKIHSEHFVSIAAIRLTDAQPDTVQALSLQDLYAFSPAKIRSTHHKLKTAFNVLCGLWLLDQTQHFTGYTPLSSFLYTDRKSSDVKIKPYLSVQIEGFKFGEPKKDKAVANNGIELCFDFLKIPHALDIWKWAVFASSLLFHFSFEKYIDSVLGCEKIQQFSPQIGQGNDFPNSGQLLKLLTMCLNPNPQKRPTFPEIAVVFERMVVEPKIVDEFMLGPCSEAYLKEQQSIRSVAEIEISENILLTDELKKKLTATFVKNGLKGPKSYRPLYRATRFQFNARVYYQMCSGNDKLLFVIDSEEGGLICCYIAPKMELREGEGLAGAYIEDESKHSFIYSVKNQQSYKLQKKERAYRAVPGRGPIIGDGDIMLGSRNSNECNFPQSYQTGKHKTLMKQVHFRVKNYDVYLVSF